MRICKESTHQFVKTNNVYRTFFNRIHLLYVDSPEISSILLSYPEVKRIIIPEKFSNIANSTLKESKIKWYVTNTKKCNPLKFFKKNNVIAWNFSVESYIEIADILEICDVVLGTQDFLDSHTNLLNSWSGDFVLMS